MTRLSVNVNKVATLRNARGGREPDVIEAVEGPITLNVCVDGSSSCALQPTCRMFRVWEEGQRVLLEIFSQTTLKEIAASRPAPMRLARGSLVAAAADKEATVAKI